MRYEFIMKQKELDEFGVTWKQKYRNGNVHPSKFEIVKRDFEETAKKLAEQNNCEYVICINQLDDNGNFEKVIY